MRGLVSKVWVDLLYFSYILASESAFLAKLLQRTYHVIATHQLEAGKFCVHESRDRIIFIILD